jgi:NAD(P)-dependent dehydrogenase (short-subunit alcohol dehydrogenase family)
MQRFEGRVAAVTGASSGIGAAIAAALAGEGAQVVGFARRFGAPGVAAAGAPVPGRVREVRLDVTDEAEVRARFAELPALDILVMCAGNFLTAPLLEASAAELRGMLDVHVVGAFLCAREALRHMAPRRRGHIVNVSSIAAFRTFPGASAYTAAKEAQRGLTRVLVEEARAFDVRVTGLYPGATDTPAWDGTGMDRGKMMAPAALAGLVVDVLARPELSVEELVVLPPAGVL